MCNAEVFYISPPCSSPHIIAVTYALFFFYTSLRLTPPVKNLCAARAFYIKIILIWGARMKLYTITPSADCRRSRRICHRLLRSTWDKRPFRPERPAVQLRPPVQDCPIDRVSLHICMYRRIVTCLVSL